MMAIADGLAKIAGPGATVRGVQDIGAAPVAADPVDRRHPLVALNLDLDLEKERGFAASALQDWHGLYVLLILEGPLDDGQRCPTHGRNEVTVGPERRKAGFQPRKLVSRQPGRSPLCCLDHAMDSERRIDKRWTWSGMTSVSSKMPSVSLATSAMICLSRLSTPLTSTWRRYFGQKTTWS
jgi:hypothetical protein